MNTKPLDGAEIHELIDRAEIKDGQAIVAYSRTQAAVAELRQKYQGAKYDLTTTAGDKAARAGRLELVTTRTSLEKKRKELKAPAVEFGRMVDAEAARLAAEILALEGPIDAQIKADEQRRENERRAREEAEAARKKVHTDAIAKIAGYVALAADLPSERIGAGITFLEGMELAGFEEYTSEATETRNRTVEALRALQTKAKAREEEAARLKAEREEQARVAARFAEHHPQHRMDRPYMPEFAEQPPAPVSTVEAFTGASVHQMPPRQSPPSTPPGLRLGEINRRLAPLSVDAAGLAALGLPHSATDKAAKLWHEHQFDTICDALIAHIAAAQRQQQAA